MPVDQLISFGMGVDWIKRLWGTLRKRRETYRAELEAINTIIFGDPMDIAEYYVEPDCQEMNPADRPVEDFLVAKEPVMKKIDQFFQQPSFHLGSNQLFILSDAGMGKTALLTMLKLMHLTRFWPGQKDCVLKKLGKDTLSEIDGIMNRSETILLLDSLDEDPEAYGRVRDRLIEILRATRDFDKVIITCRTQFFPKDVDEDPFKRPGQVVLDEFTCPAKYLSFFSDEKVNAYLDKRFPKKIFGLLPDKQKMEEAQRVMVKMGSLRCRPMLLSYIEDLMASSISRQDGEYAIYDALVKSWLRRERSKKPDIQEKDLLDACVILATVMQIRRKRSIAEEDMDRLIDQIAEVRPIKRIEIKGRSLINRNSEGEYRFSHYSIQEFCVATLLLERLVFRPNRPIPLTDKIIQWIALSKKKPNLIELLDFQGIDLRGMNLAGIQLPGAKLSGLDFSQTTLTDANLLDADLEGANLDVCRLDGCVMSVSCAGILSADDERLKPIKWVNPATGMKFSYIPPGEFMMGGPEVKSGRFDDEKHHKVILTEGFFMQTTPVTQGQWKAVMDNNPSHFKNCGDDCPVECVSWENARSFLSRLNESEGADIFRLPTEAQWEYACRAGTTTRYYTGNSEADLKRAGWYDKNAGGKTHPVGRKEPNAFGLYDMHGNVWEWCSDWYGDYPAGTVTDPTGPSSGADRVFRGGSWFDFAKSCRSASRDHISPDDRDQYLGFRVVAVRGPR